MVDLSFTKHDEQVAPPMDQALDQIFNKPAKDARGIIGVTRRKEAVAQWCLNKHEKDCILSTCILVDKMKN